MADSLHGGTTSYVPRGRRRVNRFQLFINRGRSAWGPEGPMPDVPVAGRGSGDYDPRMEERMARVEQDIAEMKGSIGTLEHAVIRIEAMLGATLPHLATKAELNELRVDVVAGLAEMPSKTYMWGILAVLLTSYACGLAALAVLR